MDMVKFKALKQFSTVGYGNAVAGQTISLPEDIGLQMCEAGLVDLPSEPKKEKVEQKKSGKK